MYRTTAVAMPEAAAAVVRSCWGEVKDGAIVDKVEKVLRDVVEKWMSPRNTPGSP